MGLFTELYALTRHTRLAMLVTADHDTGKMTISVMPRAQPGAQPALSTDLTLTATPEEFDASFLAALTGYSRQLAPLLEQAAATSNALAETSRAAAEASRPAASRTSNKSARRGNTACSTVTTPPEGGEAVQDEPDAPPSQDGMTNRQPALF
ncbi:PRTRC system protein E [Massilia sp. YIM B04103]|uniref:PRTRC system protein E n=1 Tax=Massilia sp. YIM B04103 TaxID=2963106 RepID=UPI00210C75F1|nr:PRTRC system protein E [Massilia sp. YIM B04103]